MRWTSKAESLSHNTYTFASLTSRSLTSLLRTLTSIRFPHHTEIATLSKHDWTYNVLEYFTLSLFLHIEIFFKCLGSTWGLRVFIFKVMAPYASTLAWKIPWTKEPGRLQSMRSLSQTRLRDFTSTFHFHALEKEMATHSSVLVWRIPGWGSLVGGCLWGCTESDTTEVT